MIEKGKIIVITGSSNRFSEEILELYKNMKEEGHTVIIDSMFYNISEERGRKLFISAILQSDILLVYNKNGYIGFHTCVEIVIAKVSGIEVVYHYPDHYPKFIDNIEAKYYSLVMSR